MSQTKHTNRSVSLSLCLSVSLSVCPFQSLSSARRPTVGRGQGGGEHEVPDHKLDEPKHVHRTSCKHIRNSREPPEHWRGRMGGEGEPSEHRWDEPKYVHRVTAKHIRNSRALSDHRQRPGLQTGSSQSKHSFWIFLSGRSPRYCWYWVSKPVTGCAADGSDVEAAPTNCTEPPLA